MTYQRTENNLVVEKLMDDVEALDPDLAERLSVARCNEFTEAENRAVLVHGRHILAVIEGQGQRLAVRG
jgi:hypothetical protein